MENLEVGSLVSEPMLCIYVYIYVYVYVYVLVFVYVYVVPTKKYVHISYYKMTLS